MLEFSTQLCELLPLYLTFSLVPLPPPPLPKVQVHYVHYIQILIVCGREWLGGEVLSCVGDHILQEFNTIYLTRLRTYESALPPETKPRRGRGPQTDKHLPQSPFTNIFFR